jgi:hypothetical protein
MFFIVNMCFNDAIYEKLLCTGHVVYVGCCELLLGVGCAPTIFPPKKLEGNEMSEHGGLDLTLLSKLEDYKSLHHCIDVLNRQKLLTERDLKALYHFKKQQEEEEEEEEEEGDERQKEGDENQDDLFADEEEAKFLDEKKLFIITQVVAELPDIDMSVYEAPPSNNNVNKKKRKRNSIMDDELKEDNLLSPATPNNTTKNNRKKSARK